jgi:hypothetical protein
MSPHIQMILAMIPLWGSLWILFYVLINDTFPPDRPKFA